MGPTQIGLLILGGVALMAAFAYIAQSIENARRERQLKLMELRTEIRRAQHLLSNFPALFMTTDIQQLLVRYLLHKWEKTIELEDTPEHQAQLAKVKEQEKAKIQPVPHPEGSLTAFPDPGSAAKADGELKEFMKFLAEAESKGDISAKLRGNFENRARKAHSRIACELDIFEAIAIEGMTGGSAALPKLRNAFFRLENINQGHTLDRQLYEVRTHLDKLAEEKKQEEAAREIERQKAREEEEQFNKMTF